MIAGTRSVYFLYSTGSLIMQRASQYAGICFPSPQPSPRVAGRGGAHGLLFNGGALDLVHLVETDQRLDLGAPADHLLRIVAGDAGLHEARDHALHRLRDGTEQ